MAGISAKIPVQVDVVVDLSNLDNMDDLFKVEDYLKDYYSRHAKDWGLNVTVTPDVEREQVRVEFKGDGVYTYYPSNSYYDPDDWDIPFEEDSFTYDVAVALKDMPFDVLIKGTPFVADKTTVYTDVVDLPSDEDIDSAISAQYPEDYYEYESVLKSLLNGNTLTQALTERSFDSDVDSEEVYKPSDAQKFALEFDDWKKEATTLIKQLSELYPKFENVLYHSEFSDAFTKVPSLSKPKVSNLSMQTWLGFLLQQLDKYDPMEG